MLLRSRGRDPAVAPAVALCSWGSEATVVLSCVLLEHILEVCGEEKPAQQLSSKSGCGLKAQESHSQPL